MAMRKIDRVNGPIPGEHLTSEERNYPWHRAPDFDDLNSAMEFIITELDEEEVLLSGLNLLENEVTIAELTQLMLMGKMMEGRFTLDYALLLAGPVAKYISIIAEKSGVEASMGIESDYMYFSKGVLDDSAERADLSDFYADKLEASDEEEAAAEGLMNTRDNDDVASEEEQAAMLGYAEEEVTV